MAKIVVVGGGLVGMASASLLGKDGHDVLVLERDSAPTPSNAEDAWASWERRGVGQFRQAYGIAPRLTPLLEEELPEINRHLERLGAYRWNFTSQLDPALPERRKLMEECGRFALTARRPTMEAAFAMAAEDQPGVTFRRGVALKSYSTSRQALDRVPNIDGVVLETGETIEADLVVDATGRVSGIRDGAGRP